MKTVDLQSRWNQVFRSQDYYPEEYRRDLKLRLRVVLRSLKNYFDHTWLASTVKKGIQKAQRWFPSSNSEIVQQCNNRRKGWRAARCPGDRFYFSSYDDLESETNQESSTITEVISNPSPWALTSGTPLPAGLDNSQANKRLLITKTYLNSPAYVFPTLRKNGGTALSWYEGRGKYTENPPCEKSVPTSGATWKVAPT